MLAALVPASAASAAGNHPVPAGHSFTGVRAPVGPPVGRPKPAAAAPDLTPGQPSPWKALKNAPPSDPGTMLLASDGTVLVHSEPPAGGTSAWYKLTPNAKGSYAGGTWSKVASMPGGYNPLYFASAILPDGQMIVEGGEYLGGTPTWTSKGAIYNPVSNTWRRVAPPGGWTNIGDAQSDVLANGTFVLSQACQDNTNFPVVRITNLKTGVVSYARTHNWTSVPVAPGTASSTHFTIPGTTPAGPSSLVVVANGIASSPVRVTIR